MSKRRTKPNGFMPLKRLQTVQRLAEWSVVAVGLMGGLGGLSFAHAQTAMPSPSTTVLNCGRLLDVTTLKLVAEQSIVVEAKKITRVSAGYVTIANARTVDLKNHTCLPGLIDLHVHLSSELNPARYAEGFSLNPPDYAVRGVANAEKTLMAGFTSVRDLGSPP
ncbi:MAG: amidohydrolase family protein, partial [Burkholderiales bacterium]